MRPRRELRPRGPQWHPLAIGLGLARYALAATDLRALLAKYRKDDQRAGPFAQALALLCDTSAEPLLRKVLAVSPRRPELLKQLAQCIGWLGSRDAAPQVAQLLLFPSRKNSLITGSAVADAVALCRDESTLTKLVQLLRDPTCSAWTRAGAAAALGSIGPRPAAVERRLRRTNQLPRCHREHDRLRRCARSALNPWRRRRRLVV